MNGPADLVWRRGFPNYPGWWNASDSMDQNEWRWFDGNCWSISVTPNLSAKDVGDLATYRSQRLGLQYRTWYPENARVPRIDPNARINVIRDLVRAGLDRVVPILTADGVEVLPGDKVWVNGSVSVEHTTVQPVVALTGYHLGAGLIPVARAYSTEAAARKARYRRG